jgi:N-acetylglucosaminyl-diphospho-decaprenol L-rhamnosyltransferase
VLSVVVISFNTAALTQVCLRSVLEQTQRTDCELIVVDNDSTDGSADAIEREFPGVRLIRSARNLGFAAANNLAAAESRGEYLLLLNPDTVILEGAIDKLMAFAESRPDAGIWGGRTLFPDGRLNPTSCWRRLTLWSLISAVAGLSAVFPRNRLFNPDAYGGWARDGDRRVDIVTGCFLLIRRELWDRLGGFDPTFFMYGEDADLCLRAARLGARPMVTSSSTIVHHGGASETVRTEKVIRLLIAWRLLIRVHWHRRVAWLGLLLLSGWVLSRASVWGALVLIGSTSAREPARNWKSVWQRRQEWVATIPLRRASLAQLTALT